MGGVLLLAACVWGIMHHKRRRDRTSAETASAGVRPEEVSDIPEVPAVESPEVKEEEVEKEPSEWEELPAVLPPDKNAIFLFGMFTILDNAGLCEIGKSTRLNSSHAGKSRMPSSA